jgi:hypothetical protein
MNLLLLRGRVPTDRGKDGWKEITYPNIGQCDDIYTLIAYAMTRDSKNDFLEVVYGGKPERKQFVDSNAWEFWTPALSKYVPRMPPDVVFARGGFPEYRRLLERCHNAKRVYYGAGRRFLPELKKTYDLILVDSYRQKAVVKAAFPKTRCEVWVKAAPPCFRPMPEVEKKYDVCYVAVHPADSRKCMEWVHKTVPSDLSVLQIGNRPEYAPPPNVTVVRALRREVPRLMNQCRVGIVPYTTEDSGPRCLYEMAACKLPVVACEEVHLPVDRIKCYMRLKVAQRSRIWAGVREAMSYPLHPLAMPTVHGVAKQLRGWIDEL